MIYGISMLTGQSGFNQTYRKKFITMFLPANMKIKYYSNYRKLIQIN